MTALITAQEIKEIIELDLPDSSIDRLIDAADQEIADAHGAHASEGTVTELHIGGDTGLFLNRVISSITTVTEFRGTITTVLDSTDYRSWFDGRVLERLSLNATNPQARWAERVEVVYTPVDDDLRRIAATIDLVRLATQYNGLEDERAGDYWATQKKDYFVERSRIINSLGRKRRLG